MNVVQGKWKKIVDGYGNMVLGYFGHTPRTPDPEIVKIAAEQLGKEPFRGDPLDVLEDGIPKARKVLEDNALPLTDENIFIAATCGDKGVTFLKGDAKVNVYYKEEEKKPESAKVATAATPAPITGPREFSVNVNGQMYHVGISPAQ